MAEIYYQVEVKFDQWLSFLLSPKSRLGKILGFLVLTNIISKRQALFFFKNIIYYGLKYRVNGLKFQRFKTNLSDWDMEVTTNG